MGYNPGRAAVAALAVLAVVFAASMFPAAGFGSYPGGVGGSPATPGDAGEPGNAPPGPDVTETPDPVVTETSSESGGTETPTETPAPATPDPDESETPNPGTTETPTETPGSGSAGSSGDSGGSSDLWSVFRVLVTGAFVVCAVVVTLGWVGTLAGWVVVSRVGGRVAVDVGGRRIPVGRLLGGVSEGTMAYVLALSSGTLRLVEGIGSSARNASGALAGLPAAGAALSSALAGVGRAVVVGTGSLGGAFLALPRGMGASLGGLARWRPGWSSDHAPATDAREVAADPERSEEDAPPDPPGSVVEAWRRFVRSIPVRGRDRSTMTPVEVAEAAVENGAPRGPVRRLTRAFREVRYGGREVSAASLDVARDALGRIRRRLGGGEEG